ncbi:class I SAM-dependent methyltransferase [Mycobacterium sp. CVI_P3]|uniref:Class I SAM-dependent methyltransferase n=1 Tax=Mycobacterium pinniadriaticum TaxID=2994102 RepID=A0ABT3SHZ6_9MYCO|nr:class I SAM-dependent methyltransferase [Mycobacterium pinniadriaticum]MCX2932659.1 class I SAM-dependent methyltransferase [Mycobacterium pinniadriaticum]MCX2939083.1 class I SAM-dependent methyltransferase [Mycobacterium pinniadriaticum]
MDTDHHAHWETRYAEKPRIWSGRPNTRLAEIAAELTGTRALDLGCGEGGDAMWLAEHGWQVVAVDVSTTALARAAEDARARGVLGHIDFQQHDLTQTLPEGPFDLVSAHFFHTMLEMDRLAILRRAAATVAPGGTLLIVDHGAAPPWAPEEVHHHEFPSAQEVLAGLTLDDAQWETVRLGPAERDAVGPDGQQVRLIDNVIQMRRISS